MHSVHEVGTIEGNEQKMTLMRDLLMRDLIVWRRLSLWVET